MLTSVVVQWLHLLSKPVLDLASFVARFIYLFRKNTLFALKQPVFLSSIFTNVTTNLQRLFTWVFVYVWGKSTVVHFFFLTDAARTSHFFLKVALANFLIGKNISHRRQARHRLLCLFSLGLDLLVNNHHICIWNCLYGVHQAFIRKVSLSIKRRM